MFNIKHDRLPPGSLIRMCESFWPMGSGRALEKGAIGFVIQHSVPVKIQALFGGSLVVLDFTGLASLTGHVGYFELVSLPEGVRAVEKRPGW